MCMCQERCKKKNLVNLLKTLFLPAKLVVLIPVMVYAWWDLTQMQNKYLRDRQDGRLKPKKKGEAK